MLKKFFTPNPYKELFNPVKGDITEADIDRVAQLEEKISTQVAMRRVYNSHVATARRTYLQNEDLRLQNAADGKITQKAQKLLKTKHDAQVGQAQKLISEKAKSYQQAKIEDRYRAMLSSGD